MATLLGGTLTAPVVLGADSLTHPLVDNPSSFLVRDSRVLERGETLRDMLGRLDPINALDGTSYRVYLLEMDTGKNTHLQVRSDNFAPSMALYAPDGTLLEHARTDGPDARELHLLHQAVRKGSYLVVVGNSRSGRFGSFELSAGELAGVTALDFPDETSGQLIAAGPRHPGTGAAVTRYTLDLAEPTVIDLRVDSHDFDTFLTLSAQNSPRTLAESDDWRGSTSGTGSRIIRPLEAGTYDIAVTGYETDSQGVFSLQVGESHIAESADFRPGNPYDGLMTADLEPIAATGRTGKPLPFTVSEPSLLDATMRSDDVDSILVITDEQGRVRAEDDDSGGNLDARVLVNLEPGDYTLWASGYAENGVGPFRLETQLVPASDVTVHKERLSSTDPVDERRQTPSREHLFEVEDRSQFVLELQSTAFDAYLVLEDDSGNVVAENDDFADYTTDARIARELATGTYRAIATSYAPQESGEYTLSIRRVTP
ncbi:MAG: PPC domain-containing protein [Pseudomonadota bacterium]